MIYHIMHRRNFVFKKTVSEIVKVEADNFIDALKKLHVHVSVHQEEAIMNIDQTGEVYDTTI